MAIFIICNREIRKSRSGKLRFRDQPKERQKASHDFRVAEYFSDKNDYKIIGDLNDDNYEGVAKNKNKKLKGTANMFNKIYQQNLSDNKEQSGDILFFIHGFQYKFRDNLKHIKVLEELYLNNRSNVKHLVYVSWPSRGRILKYKDDQRDARETGRVLGRLFEKLRSFFIDTFDVNNEEPCNHKIHLAAHSMGNQVLYKMLQHIDKTQIFSVFSEVFLFNADARYDGFEPGEPFTLLQQISERTHIYIHNSDDALWISDKTKDNTKRLGRSGPKKTESLNEETFVIDTSNLVGAKKNNTKETLIDHWGYLNRKEVINDVIEVMANKRVDVIKNRQKYKEKNNYFFLGNQD